jgi:hypothetical protein
MPCRHIHPAADSLPVLSLPSGALAHTDRTYDYDVGRDPPNVEPIEHKIRLAFMAGGSIRRDELLGEYNPWTYDPEAPDADPWAAEVKPKPRGLEYAEATCRRTIDEEVQYFEHYEDDAVLATAPAFLADRLRSVRERPNPERALEDERERRESWYQKLIPGMNLYQILKSSSYGSLIETKIGVSPDASALTQQNAFVGMVIVDEEIDPDAYATARGIAPEYVIREDRLSSGRDDVSPTLSDFGITRPAPLLVGEYVTGGQYPFLPWGDALVCSCPYKHDKAWRVMCKHELLAAVVAGSTDSIFLPVTRGIEVPHRARRFVSPDIAATHTPGTDPHGSQS